MNEPEWQPIDRLPMLTSHVAAGVEMARDQLGLLRQAHPYRLDDATVARVIRTFEVTCDDLQHLFAEQGRRWQDQTRGTRHESAAEHFCALVATESDLVAEILALAERLRPVTIDKLAAKTDLEIGLEALLDPRLRPSMTRDRPETAN